MNFFYFFGGLFCRFLLKDIIDNLFLVNLYCFYFVVALLLDVGSEGLLQFAVIGEVLERVGKGSDGNVESWVGLVGLFEYSPECRKSGLFWCLRTGMVDGDSSCQYLEFLELVGAIVCRIFCVYFFKEGGGLLDFASLLKQVIFPVNFLNLLHLEVILALKICYFGEFFVDVADLLLERSQERFVLLVYSFYFVFVVVAFLWVGFF